MNKIVSNEFNVEIITETSNNINLPPSSKNLISSLYTMKYQSLTIQSILLAKIYFIIQRKVHLFSLNKQSKSKDLNLQTLFECEFIRKLQNLLLFQHISFYPIIISDKCQSKIMNIKLSISKSRRVFVNKRYENKYSRTKNYDVNNKKLQEERVNQLLGAIDSMKRLASPQINKQINLDIKKILTCNKSKLMGGGGCCSKNEITSFPYNEIQHDDLTDNHNAENKEFENKYEKYLKSEIIIENIQNNTQLKVQEILLQQCILDELIQNEDQVNKYHAEILNIFENCLMLEITRGSMKSSLQQKRFSDMLQILKSLESYENDYPMVDLIFYVDMLNQLNNTNENLNTHEENEIKKIKEFMIEIQKFKKGENNFDEIISKINQITLDTNQNGFKQNIKILNRRYGMLLPLKYETEIWLTKVIEFGDKFQVASLDQEILFYVKIFFEISSQEHQRDQIILTLIRINSLLEKLQNNKSINNTTELSIKSHENSSIYRFQSQLMQNSNMFDQMLFLVFTIENKYYRYITLSILLLFNSLLKKSENLLDFLSHRYLTEYKLEIRVLFERNIEFIEYFNTQIQKDTFKERMIEFDKQRKKNLLPYVESLAKNERSIQDFGDIIKLISENAIQKWENDIKKRQRQNIAQKDDTLLEVKDLYINQSISYLKGNPIFQKVKLNSAKQLISDSHSALSDILKLFLIPDYSYRLKYLQNGDDTNYDECEFKNQSNSCQILGIIAEGGTGKSMLMKKIEIFLIEKLSNHNTQSEKEKVLPLLVKCASLNSTNPSLNEFLSHQGMSNDMIQSLKQSERKKLILLDGYDEYTGEFFNIYRILKINEWTNTKVVVTSRQEKLSEEDACFYFSKLNKSEERDEMSYSLIKLEEFTTNDIHEYAERYFKQERKNNQERMNKDKNHLKECLSNSMLENLLRLPINLYLFTRMLIKFSDAAIQDLKSKVSEQIGMQEVFFNDQFEREAQSIIDYHIDSVELKKNKDFKTSLQNCYFEYFQTIAITMFLQRGEVKGNYLQVERSNIKYTISFSFNKNYFNSLFLNSLQDKIKNYVNSKIITRLKQNLSDTPQFTDKQQKYQPQFIEFKHKSLYEYFTARAMKYDFDTHKENIYKLSIGELKKFNINKRSIMNPGENQSEQQVLIKLYKLIKIEIECDEFYSNYYLKQIEKNNRYIQYIKKSTISFSSSTSDIDIGASNMLSALFISKFAYSKLELRSCSLSKLYVCCSKSNTICFEKCNLQNACLRNLNLNYRNCNTELTYFDAYRKDFEIEEGEKISSVAFSTNRKYLATGSWGKTCKIWNADKGFELINTIQGHSNLINSVAFSADGSYLATGSYDHTCKIWNAIKDFELIITIQGHNDSINSVAFSVDGKYLATGSEDKSCKIWNAEKGFELINTIQDHTLKINSVAFSADGKYLATGSGDKTCKIWNAEKGFELINTIQGHNDSIKSVAFSSDGKYLATGSDDKACKIWNAEKGFELINTILGHTKDINSVAFSADGKYLATGSYDKSCKIWNVVKDFELINTIQGHNESINSVAFSVDGKHIATGSYDETCKIWNLEKGFEFINAIQGHPSQIYSVAFSEDGKYLATGSWDNTCKIWNAQKGFELINTIQGHTHRINSIAFSADVKYLATGSSDYTCKLWNAEKGFEFIITIQGHTQDITSVAFSADGKYLATGSEDGTCKIWNAERCFELINTIQGHTDWMYSVAFSANGKYLATGSQDGICEIWNAEKGFELINTIQGHNEDINSVAFSADGKYLATGSSDYTCKIWNAEKGFKLIKTIEASELINSVAFSADGKYLATGSDDHKCKIWNAEQGFKLINKIKGHTSQILSVAFSADGKYLATGSWDSTCKIWNKIFENIYCV